MSRCLRSGNPITPDDEVCVLRTKDRAFVILHKYMPIDTDTSYDYIELQHRVANSQCLLSFISNGINSGSPPALASLADSENGATIAVQQKHAICLGNGEVPVFVKRVT